MQSICFCVALPKGVFVVITCQVPTLVIMDVNEEGRDEERKKERYQQEIKAKGKWTKVKYGEKRYILNDFIYVAYVVLLVVLHDYH